MSRRDFPMLMAGLSLLPLLGVGCGPSNSRPSIEGSVVYQGKPVAHQTLTLRMVAEKPEDSFSHSVRIGADGTFKGDAPAVGTYKVVIAPPISVREGRGGDVLPIPAKYREAATTDLTWTIAPGKNQKDFVLVD